MKKFRTELVFILDRSGSMSGLEADTIGGYNSMLQKQKMIPSEVSVTTVLFDDQYELLHDRASIMGISDITSEDYFVRGNTALYDAVGKTIKKIENSQKHLNSDHKASQVIFVITTDGMENSSREYSSEIVRNMINSKKETGWEFIFLGANIDAIATAREFGIPENRAANYHADSKGTRLNYEVVSEAISCLRAQKCISDDWKAEIDKDYESRRES